MSKLRGFFAELVRRQMFRTVGAYRVPDFVHFLSASWRAAQDLKDVNVA